MSADEHHEIFESLGAYALGALPDGERAAVAAHIETCPVCAEDAASLQRAATSLIETVPQLEPSPELRGRIMAVVESEAALLRASASTPNPQPTLRKGSDPFKRVSLRWVAVAAALLVIGGVVGAVWPVGGGSSTRTLAASARGAQRAWLEVRGDRAQLVVDGLAQPPAGKVYEVWIQHGSEAPAPAGSLFVVRSGRVDLPTRVAHGDRFMVTAEPAGGSAAPTSTPVVVTQRL